MKTAVLLLLLAMVYTADAQDTSAFLSNKMDTVVVKGRRPLYQRQPAGLILNVQGNLMAKGSSVLDILQQSPGVRLDLQNNQLYLNSKSGVEVMINGRLLGIPMDQVAALMRSIPAEDIEKIELLDTPPVSMDAQGSAGLINIVLKRTNKPGTTGNLSLTGGFGTREKALGNISMDRNTGKWNWNAAYSFLHDRSTDNLRGSSHQIFPPLGGDIYVDFFNDNKRRQGSHTASVAAGKTLSDHLRIGGAANVNFSKGATEVNNRRTITLVPDSVSRFKARIYGQSQTTNALASVFLDTKSKNNAKLHLGADYILYTTDAPTMAENHFLSADGKPQASTDSVFAPLQKGLASTRIHVGVFKVDWSRLITSKLSAEAGAKVNYTGSHSVSGIQSAIGNDFFTRPETSNDITMKEKIGAVYVAMHARTNTTASFDAGLRYEYSITQMNNADPSKVSVNRTVSSLFPFFTFSVKPAAVANFFVSYTKRIGRPTYQDLSSYIRYNDPLSVFTGNPYLLPTITHNLKTGFSYNNLSLTATYSRDVHPVNRYQIVESPGRDLMYIGPQNGEWQHSFSMQLSEAIKPKPWWTVNLSVSSAVTRYREQYSKYPLEKAWFGYTGNMTQSFSLPRQFLLEVSGWYNSDSYNGMVMEKGFGSVNTAIRKELNKGKGTLQLSATDVFRTIRYRPFYGKLTEEAFMGSSDVSVRPESGIRPVFRLTFSKKFGSGIFKSKDGNPGPADEQERLK